MALYVGNKKYCVVKKIGLLNTDIEITHNGRYIPSDFGDFTGFGIVDVNIPDPVLEQITINPSTELQTITPSNGVYGIDEITVNPVTASIDANIIPSNIKKGITILGVDGDLEFITDALEINPTKTLQTITPTHDGFSTVTVNPVTHNIDGNIISSNIRSGVTILGVDGSIIEANNTTITATRNATYTPSSPYTGYSEVVVNIPLESKTINPSTSSQTITHPNNGGYSTITVNPVTAAIDSDIKPQNIVKGINILGVDGEIEFEPLTVNPSSEQRVYSPASGGYSSVTVNAVSSAIDVNIAPENILSGVSILGVDGGIVLDSTTVTPSLTQQTITHPTNNGAPGGYTTVIVNPVTAAIDADIISSNIRKGVNILGVNGNIDFEALSVTPSTSLQTFTPTKDGYSSVEVSAVTSAIDADIIPANIMSGVNILGVDGAINFETKTITPTTEDVTYTPTTGVNGFSSVTVNGVSSDIDENIVAGNIKSGVTILGVTGTFSPDLQTLNVTPSVQSQVITPDGFDGYSSVTVAAVPSTIDVDISPENIRSGIDVLGVTGTLEELKGETREVALTNVAGNTFTPSTDKTGITSITVTPTNQNKTITATTTEQVINVPTNYSGFGTLTVNPVSNDIDSNITAGNIKSGVTILGVEGTVTELHGQTKTIYTNGTYTPDTGYNAFTQVEVDIDTVNNQNIEITTNGTYTPGTGYTGFGEVAVNIDTVNNTNTTITPTTSLQTITPGTGYTGFAQVRVNAVTNEIDENIVAGNIKKDVTILGVTGTLEEVRTQEGSFVVNANTETVTILTPEEGYDAFSQVEIDLSYIEQKLQALNGSTTVNTDVHIPQTLTIVENGTYTPDPGYTEFDEVTVNVIDDSLDKFINGVGIYELTLTTANVRNYACYYLDTLEKVTSETITNIGVNAFANTNLTRLVLTNSSVATLSDVNAFANTPIANGTGYIYVPANLVDSYKSATNWSAYMNNIRSVNDYPNLFAWTYGNTIIYTRDEYPSAGDSVYNVNNELITSLDGITNPVIATVTNREITLAAGTSQQTIPESYPLYISTAQNNLVWFDTDNRRHNGYIEITPTYGSGEDEPIHINLNPADTVLVGYFEPDTEFDIAVLYNTEGLDSGSDDEIHGEGN